MTYIEGIDKIGKEKYEAFNKEHGNVMQSVGWAKVKKNWENKQVAIYNEKEEIVAIASILIKRFPLGYCMYYIPRGPIADKVEDVATLLNQIRIHAKADKCVFIKFDPYILDNEFTKKAGRPNGHNTLAVDILTKGVDAIHKGYTMTIEETVQPRTTMGIKPIEGFEKNYARDTRRKMKKATQANLTYEVRTKDDLMAGDSFLTTFANLMHKTEENYARDTRRKMKKATQANLTYEVRTKDDLMAGDSFLTTFANLMHKTEERNSVVLRSEGYFRDIMNSVEGAVIGFAKTEAGDYVSGNLCILYGKRMEMLYMGNDIELCRKTEGSRFLYDKMFHYAQFKGIEYCDMGGVEGSLEDGLANHKNSYGGIVREYIGEFDLPVRPWLYKMILPIYERKTGNR